jgi:uncharacterized DUF497 family protein
LLTIEFDPAKDAINREKHGVSLARARDIDIVALEHDERYEYGEWRFRGWGYIDGVAYCLAFTTRDGRIRAISLRRAHRKEMRRYA